MSTLSKVNTTCCNEPLCNDLDFTETFLSRYKTLFSHVLITFYFILSILYIYVVDHCVQDGGGSPGH